MSFETSPSPLLTGLVMTSPSGFRFHPIGLMTGSPNMSRKVDWRSVSRLVPREPRGAWPARRPHARTIQKVRCWAIRQDSDLPRRAAGRGRGCLRCGLEPMTPRRWRSLPASAAITRLDGVGRVPGAAPSAFAASGQRRIAQALGYCNNQHRMGYAHLPVGSGVVEATCKTERLKRSTLEYTRRAGDSSWTPEQSLWAVLSASGSQ